MKITNIVLLYAALLPVISGCPHQPSLCSLDSSSPDPAIAACATEDSASCVVNTHPACNGEVCVKWRGHPGQCSSECRSNADCGAFEDCVEVVLASGAHYCVNSDRLD